MLELLALKADILRTCSTSKGLNYAGEWRGEKHQKYLKRIGYILKMHIQILSKLNRVNYRFFPKSLSPELLDMHKRHILVREQWLLRM
jgi:hypothetical protein